MAVRYDIQLEYKNGDVVTICTFNNDTDTKKYTPQQFSQLEEYCRNFDWRSSVKLRQKIGEHLFGVFNGDNLLERALAEADAQGELLQVFIHTDSAPDLPFELLYHAQFLAPSKVHIVRHVSDYGYKKPVATEDRPLRILFMACSPLNVSPVLDFEKEEEKILEITKDLPVIVDVEDTGSLQGLHECLGQHEYDIVHLTGHADIDGIPVFLMEDEEGSRHKVTPSELQGVLHNSLKRPRLVFLSGCKTAQAPEAAASFAHHLVLNHSPTVVGWGLPVTDEGAIKTAETLYYNLSRGNSIIDAVFSARRNLFDLFKKKELITPDWSLLRLFSDGTPLGVPLVEREQEKIAKAREIQYAYLLNSKVKVLKKGFVGRRRQLQRGITCLKSDEGKIGVLLHGTGGLGKSCLAGKFCDRFKDHALIIVHGELNDFTFFEAVKSAFIRTGDDEALKVLQEEDTEYKIRKLCASSFQGKYLIVLDDFEKNLEGYEQGSPVLCDEASLILKGLLQYLPLTLKMTQVIITSRYTFPLISKGEDLITETLELIGLTSFRGADERKKISELKNIDDYPKRDVRQKLIDAGRGNPRLMEALNILVGVEKEVDETLLTQVKGKQEEFVQELVLRTILESQPGDFQKVLQYSSVYELPVSREGIEKVCSTIKGWESFLDSGIQLSLVEKGKDKTSYYWVTPLLREELFKALCEVEQKKCHEAAVLYYQDVLAGDEYYPEYAFELIEHALQCGRGDAAVGEGGRLLNYLRNALLYKEALYEGMRILSNKSGLEKDEKTSRFFFEFGWILKDIGKAEECSRRSKESYYLL